VADQFYGDRSGGIEDPFGHHWYVATHKEDVTPEEMKRRADGAVFESKGEDPAWRVRWATRPTLTRSVNEALVSPHRSPTLTRSVNEALMFPHRILTLTRRVSEGVPAAATRRWLLNRLADASDGIRRTSVIMPPPGLCRLGIAG